jgi:2-[(L-alanin-3-ylcarbamoyl)methyl]-2-hydroxybutanedioate decarboxylase
MTVTRARGGRIARTAEQAVRALIDEGDRPVCAYVYDLPALQSHARRLIDTLPARCRLYYAVKANSERPILESLTRIVDGFEVASLGEVLRVRSVAPDAPIVFGGPGKTDDELAGAIRHGVELVHVESAHELRRLERVAQDAGTVVPVLLRVNLAGPLPVATLAMAGRPTQFGIDERDVPEVAALAHRSPYLRLDGFHFHSVSNQLDAAAHARLVGLYLERATAWAQPLGMPVRTVNAGGGIGVNYADTDDQFAWEDFTRELTTVLTARAPRGCSVTFELGRYLLAAHGTYAAEVLDVKTTHGETFAVVRGGTHHLRLPASWQHSHPFGVLPVDRWDGPTPRPEAVERPVTVVGQLCSPKDVLARGVTVPRIRAGDVVLFHYAGAYGWSISHHDFLSHPHPRQLYLR